MNRKVVQIRTACSFARRARGLILQPALPAEVALYLLPCRCVHTAFMRRCIDVVFLDQRRVVLKIVPELKPWRITGHARACGVLEFNAGEVRRLGLRPGDGVALVDHGERRHAMA